MTNFLQKLQNSTKSNNSHVCVGLDTDIELIPESVKAEVNKTNKNAIFEFNRRIIDATADLVCCYKPNSAFYEANGNLGQEALEQTIKYIPKNIPIILDAKRGDIGNTSEQYAKSCFEHLDVDAVTVNPYMGIDAVAPFAKYEEKTTIILVKTSNKSSDELQNLELKDGKLVYIKVAELINEWQKSYKSIFGAVVGATYPAELKAIREVIPNTPILIPGLGAQGGDEKNTIINGLGPNGDAPIIVSSSRGIIFASKESDFDKVARQKCQDFKDKLNSYK